MAESKVGPNAEGLRVAIVGSGPAGFYAAELLLQKGASVDLFERLPAPFGLLRYGVAPDHQNIKRAGAAFERTARHERFRYFGNVELGRDLSVFELLADYDQVLIAIGSGHDRKLGIPGEDLHGSVAATSFVSWYNGHPDFASQTFELTSERAVVVGMGNVAMDVARILVKKPEALAGTDIAGYALSVLRTSAVREVVLLGRRGPAEAAFDQGELADIADLEGVEVVVDGDVSLDGVEQLPVGARRNVEYLATLPKQPSGQAERVVRLKFLAAPHELLGADDHVTAIEVEHTRLERRADGSVKAIGAGEYELVPTGLVIRSIGYQATPVAGLPFDHRASLIPNQLGRVGMPGEVVARCYVVGWIKRGPVGLLGTNKQDAKETVERMLEDAGEVHAAQNTRKPGSALGLLETRRARTVSYGDWLRIDEKERAAGAKAGKIREKLTSVAALLDALND